MQYMRLDTKGREALLEELKAMPDSLGRSFAALTEFEAMLPGPDDAFSPVEHCWHLADLEREGYAVRIRRLRAEHDPELPDFDGARIAQERNYRARSLAEGIAAFTAARRENVAAFAALTPADWSRRGTQEGVGPVSLCDIPAMMAEHDATHRQEIEAWAVSQRNR
jgi:hypothetical protein